MKDVITLIVGFLLLWGLIQMCVRSEAPVIQADIQSRTESALVAASIGNVHVSVHGRDVTLSGTVSDPVHASRAFEVADAVHGVRIVDGNIDVTMHEGTVAEPLIDVPGKRY